MAIASDTECLSRLYKYLPPPNYTDYSKTNLISILRDGEIRLTCAPEVNDPFETFPAVATPPSKAEFREKIWQFQDGPEPEDPDEMRVWRELRKLDTEALESKSELMRVRFIDQDDDPFRFTKLLGFTSLTEKSNSILMWAHYAGNHTGLCVGWRTDYTHFPGTSVAVTYSTRRVPMTTRECLGLDGPIDPQRIFDVVTTKHVDWRYEQEWRFLGTNLTRDFVAEGGTLVDFQRCAIDEIILGAKCSEETETFARELVSDLSPQPKFLRCFLSKTEFKFVLKPA